MKLAYSINDTEVLVITTNGNSPKDFIDGLVQLRNVIDGQLEILQHVDLKEVEVLEIVDELKYYQVYVPNEDYPGTHKFLQNIPGNMDIDDSLKDSNITLQKDMIIVDQTSDAETFYFYKFDGDYFNKIISFAICNHSKINPDDFVITDGNTNKFFYTTDGVFIEDFDKIVYCFNTVSKITDDVVISKIVSNPTNWLFFSSFEARKKYLNEYES